MIGEENGNGSGENSNNGKAGRVSVYIPTISTLEFAFRAEGPT